MYSNDNVTGFMICVRVTKSGEQLDTTCLIYSALDRICSLWKRQSHLESDQRESSSHHSGETETYISSSN